MLEFTHCERILICECASQLTLFRTPNNLLVLLQAAAARVYRRECVHNTTEHRDSCTPELQNAFLKYQNAFLNYRMHW